ncbi:MAG: ATP-binding cassette domain-containing protein, partial [Burkholderiales bacterium]
PVRTLSGGERNRLLLARLFAKPANVLVLDEPTNDLDIETLELLEALLADYQGTLFLVSHDRAFLDNVVTQVIAADGDGVWKEYVGGYAEWVKQRPARVSRDATATGATDGSGSVATRSRSGAARSANPAPPALTSVAAESLTRKTKLSYNEKRELEQLPRRIEALETEQAELEQRLADPATNQSGNADVAALASRREAIENELLSLLERWESLEQASRP